MAVIAVKSGNLEKISKRLSIHLIVALLVCIIGSAGFIAAQNPTPEQLKENWAKLSGKKEGKIVYLTRSTDEIVVIDLANGQSKKVADFAVANTAYGISGSVAWSPDGKRLTMQNDTFVKVMNADGSLMKTIAKAVLEGDLIVNSWSGNSAIVYSTGKKVVRTQITAENEAAATEELVTAPPEGYGYSSVTMSGDYLAYIDNWGNAAYKGGHRPLVLNVKSGESRDMVPRNSDGCQLRIKCDGTGTVMFCEWSHNKAAVVKNWNGVKIDSIPIVQDPVNNTSIQHMRWSNDTGFITVMGAPKEPKYAWIVRMSDKNSMYLGDAPYHPDLWVNPNVTVARPAQSPHSKRMIRVQRGADEELLVSFSEREPAECSVFDSRGRLLYSAVLHVNTARVVPMSRIPNGMIIIRLNTKKGLFTTLVMVSGR